MAALCGYPVRIGIAQPLLANVIQELIHCFSQCQGDKQSHRITNSVAAVNAAGGAGFTNLDFAQQGEGGF